MHEEIQLSSRRDLWDLRQVPCLGPLCPCCSKAHESMEIVLCREHQGTCGQQISPWMVQCIQDRDCSLWQTWAGELKEELCWPLNSRGNGDFTAEIKLSRQKRCLKRNLPLLEAQGSVTEAKPSWWPRLETEPKTSPSQCRGVCSQQLFCSGEQQCDSYTDLHHGKDRQANTLGIMTKPVPTELGGKCQSRWDKCNA